MSEHATRVAVLANASMAALDKTRKDAAARGDRAMAQAAHDAMQLRSRSQTPELQDCGRLFSHVETIGRPPASRLIERFTGDPMAWLQQFSGSGARGRLNRDAGVTAVETVKLRAGERITITKS